ncbi:MAG: ABC transporter permease [Eubacterium sp.]|jgi:ribose/xylose/arabinose/galactoside ABC-type transport system permease subunit|nr:ABC transporter permease [Eubacterium sp.]
MKLKLSKNWIDYIKPAMILIFVVFIIWKVPIFLRPDNLITLIPQAAVIGIASIGMSMVIISGEIDISVGAILYCSGAIASEVFMSTRSLIYASLAAVLSGAVFGLVNGFGVAKLKIPSMITTLAVSYILTGLGSILIGSESTLVAGDDYKALSQTKILGMTSNVWIFVFLFVIFAVIINKTRFGRYIYAIGDNADALRASGINVDRVQAYIFILTGLLCGVGGLLTTSRLGGTQFNMSLGTEVYCIAAVVVGGIRMSGGKGSIFGSLLGILMVASLDNILRLTHISVYLYNLVWGVVIFIIVLIDILKKKQHIWNDIHKISN